MYPGLPTLPTSGAGERMAVVISTTATPPDGGSLNEVEVIILACVGSVLGLVIVIALVCYWNRPDKSDEEMQRDILAKRGRSHTVPNLITEAGVVNHGMTQMRERAVSFQIDVSGSNHHVTTPQDSRYHSNGAGILVRNSSSQGVVHNPDTVTGRPGEEVTEGAEGYMENTYL